MASLKKLSEVLKVSQGFLKNITKGTKKGKDDYITMNTANCCRSIAFYTGYQSEEAARKAITSNVKMLYTSSDEYSNRLIKISNKYGKVRKQLLIDAAQAIKANNFTEYNKIIKSDKKLKETFTRKCAKSIKKELIEKLRSSKKSNRSTAKGILMGAGSKNGYKIIAPKEKIQKEIEKRLKRYGAVASLFWHAAKQLNPKIKAGDKKNSLSKAKRKKHRLTNGMSYKTSINSNQVSANVNHKAEKVNSKFASKLNKRIKQQENFWARQAEKQIVAAGVLNKLIDNV